MRSPVLNIAHRGASAYALENSLSSFRKAVELGADMVELDLHMTRDKKIIVMHDFNLDKTTNGEGNIVDMTLEQIKKYKLKNDETIPTLEDAIRILYGKVQLYCELKTPAMEEKFIQTVHKYSLQQQVIVGSFNHEIIRDIKNLNPEIKTSALISYVPENMVELALNLKADYLHLCWEKLSRKPYTLIDREEIKRLRENGVGIILWHEERKSHLKHLLQLDIEGVCSNKPDLVSEVLKKLQKAIAN